jgi:hypothetical protein
MITATADALLAALDPTALALALSRRRRSGRRAAARAAVTSRP